MKKAQGIFFAILLTVSSFYGGYYFGKRGFLIDIKKNPPEITVVNREPKAQTVDFSVFWEVWETLNEKFIDRPLDGKKLLYGAVSGMVSSAGDDYTSFFSPDQNKLAKSSLNGSYEGIGAELGFRDKQLIVVSPLEGSPAEASGVRPGDSILEIEGASTVGITLSEAVTKIRGEAGTVSTLKMQRGEAEPFEVKITRGTITTKSVTWKDLGDGVGYLRLARFGDNTVGEWREAVDGMVSEMPNLKGVVLDVRGNPGGYLAGAVTISSEFLKPGQTVLFEENADGTRREDKVRESGVLTKVPVVVLIDGGSASASEIVASSLRDNGRAKLVGVKSFGKGSIQNSADFKDGSSLHVTVAKWLTPKKAWIHKIGLNPDIEIQRTDEDIKTGKDPQLDKAKEVVLEGK